MTKNNHLALAIAQLFDKLLNIYKYKFPKKLILHDLIDCKKFQLFAKLLLELLANPHKLPRAWHAFKQQQFSHILTITTLSSREQRQLMFHLNKLLPAVINILHDKQQLKYIEKNFLFNIKTCLTDLINNNGYCAIKLTANNKFIIGTNISPTKNDIIYNNKIMQLIKYSPENNKHKHPILFIPPCSNKYYIFDLSEKKSLIKKLNQQGFIVYVINWLNIDFPDNNNITFDDYIVNGTIPAIQIMAQLDSSAMHIAGYCMGGTILSCTLSYVQQLNIANILSATYLLAAIDFASFKAVSPHSLEQLAKTIDKIGYLDGNVLCTVFHIINFKELILPYFIDYYLLNKPINNFEELYWYSDAINLPAKMYNFYINEICFNNKLRQPNEIIINNIKINLATITTPLFWVAGEQDPISDWRLVYDSMQIYNNSQNKQFVLANGGHISSLLAFPGNNNSYKMNHLNNINQDPVSWHKDAESVKASWWDYWINWLQKQ